MKVLFRIFNWYNFQRFSNRPRMFSDVNKILHESIKKEALIVAATKVLAWNNYFKGALIKKKIICKK